jgi:NIMA-interacting peptidyl-prolyl cis-trans isomerase 1
MLLSRSKEEATKILLAHEARIRAGETSLSELAKTESDCSSARKGGDL